VTSVRLFLEQGTNCNFYSCCYFQKFAILTGTKNHDRRDSKLFAVNEIIAMPPIINYLRGSWFLVPGSWFPNGFWITVSYRKNSQKLHGRRRNNFVN
jgi:hypothetical protein